MKAPYLVEEGKGLLELGNLVVRELVLGTLVMRPKERHVHSLRGLLGSVRERRGRDVLRFSVRMGRGKG